MKNFDVYTTISYAFRLPIDVPRGTEVSIRGKTRGCEYAQRLKLKAAGAGQCVAALTDPAGDTYDLLLDSARGQVGLITPLPIRREDAQDFLAHQVLIVAELCDRLRPKSERLSEEDRLQRDRPLFDLIQATEKRWAREHAERCKRIGHLDRGQSEPLH